MFVVRAVRGASDEEPELEDSMVRCWNQVKQKRAAATGADITVPAVRWND